MILGVVCEHSMRLEKIVDLVDPLDIQGETKREITGIAYDSRRVRAGMLFVAIEGDNLDGNRFVDEAIDRGAVAIISERRELGRRDATHLHVHSARRALAEISSAFYANPSQDLLTIGITGTNGKTTTAFMLRDILCRAGLRPGLISTVSYDIGDHSLPAERTTPESLDLQSMLSKMVSSGCRSAVMEVSSHALVQQRVYGVDFDIGVFTNLSQDHLDYHDSMEQYFAAKSMLFSTGNGFSRQLTAVINIDDEWGERLYKSGGSWGHALTYGQNPRADVRAEDVVAGEDGSRFTIVTSELKLPIEIPALGGFNISNALAAAAVAIALEIDPEAIRAALSSFQAAPGRLEEIENNRGLRIFVDYAHTDDALRSVLGTLRGIAKGRIITVFGCGGDRDRDKRILMAQAAEEFSDHAVITSDNPRKERPSDILAQIASGFESRQSYTVVEDRRQAIAAALDMAAKGDMILIAGKGHEKSQEFADTIVPFDDRDVVRSLLSDHA